VQWTLAWPREHDGIYLGSDLFRARRVRAHTGTGGYRNGYHSSEHGCNVQSFAYDFKIFAADWPGMARVECQRQFGEVLKGDRSGIDQELIKTLQDTA
jgi:hypothetical protein